MECVCSGSKGEEEERMNSIGEGLQCFYCCCEQPE